MSIQFPNNRQYDLACLGRLAVDLYGETIGVGLENTPSFQKYLGGSSANIAFGTARLGLKSAMISRVGNEQMGRFLIQTLQNEGCDTSQIQIDPERLTALVFLALKDQETFPLLFYRRDCADMNIDEAHISEEFIKNCKALLITGTHLSTEKVLNASRKALSYARKHGTKTVLDIDYRPVLWGLTSTGDGETRYIASDRVSQHLQAQLPLFDLVIGTEEEFLIAGGVENDLIASLKKARECTEAVFILKRGALGCQVLTGAIPDDLSALPIYAGERIEVLNVLGAGDAFASGFLYGLITGKNYEESARIANVCGAIVVSRHGCAPAMPTADELAYWLNKGGSRPDLDEQLQHLHRVSLKRKSWEELCVLAFDHRAQFEDLVLKHGFDLKKIPELKALIFDAYCELEKENPELAGKCGILADNTYAKQVLSDATERNPQWWIGRPVEQPSSRPLNFDRTLSIASQLSAIPKEQTIKCLVFYHPEDALELRLNQEKRLLELWEAVRHSGHELLLEVIAPLEMPASAKDKDPDSIVLRSVARFYNLGIKPDWWKLAGMRAESWEALSGLIAQHDPYCRGAVVLGLNQPEAELIAKFKEAKHPVVKGFMIGRTVWAEPLSALLQGKINADQAKSQMKDCMKRLIDGWLHRK
ncbi:MAG: 5-dehydro-2-deoxygluconokinase [Cardiobacteriaceae bacterium]|nr:5-dehydro-2-deoxygluconokinase [Cardiobacteriaceae bacterium]